MKNLMNNIFRVVAGICLCVGASPDVFSQNVATANLEWACDQATSERTQNSFGHNSVFKTSGERSVVWLQRDGAVSIAFTVVSTQGTWENVSKNGSFTYLLRRGSASGRMTIQKDGSSTSILLDFSESGEHAVKQKFRVQSVKINN